MMFNDYIIFFEFSTNLTEAFAFTPNNINTSLSRSMSLMETKPSRFAPTSLRERDNMNANDQFKSITTRNAISKDSNSETNTDFWEQQKNLAASLTSKADAQELELKR